MIEGFGSDDAQKAERNEASWNAIHGITLWLAQRSKLALRNCQAVFSSYMARTNGF